MHTSGLVHISTTRWVLHGVTQWVGRVTGKMMQRLAATQVPAGLLAAQDFPCFMVAQYLGYVPISPPAIPSAFMHSRHST